MCIAKSLSEVDLSYLFLSRIGHCQGERYASITFFCIELWYHLHILIQNWSKVAQFSKVCHRFPVAWYLNFTAFVCSNRFLVVEVQQLTWVTYFYLEYEAVKQKGMHYIFLHKLWYHYHLHIFIQSWSRGAISSKVCQILVRYWTTALACSNKFLTRITSFYPELLAMHKRLFRLLNQRKVSSHYWSLVKWFILYNLNIYSTRNSMPLGTR